MKRIIALLLALFALLSLASCGSAQSNDEKMEYKGELFGPVSVGEGIEDVYVGLDTGFVYIFKASDTETPSQYFTTSGFDDVGNCLRTIRAVDADFDGFSDLLIPFRRVDDYQYYYVYLWSPASDGFILIPSMSSIGNIEIFDGYLTGVSAEHGVYAAVKYTWKNGELKEDEETDELLSQAREYARGLLGKDAFSLTFARDELIDMTISKLYFVTENGEAVAYIAASYDGSRFFYSPLSSVYFEIIRDGDTYSKGQNYSKLEYDGTVVGYAREEYSKLSANQKEYYDMISEKLNAYVPFEFESSDAVAALGAFMKDNPVWYLCFIPETAGDRAAGKYVYSWDNYNYDTSKEGLSEKMREYSERISSLVSEMPTGLEPIEKYVYLAQKLRVEAEEEHHHGPEDGLSVYIPGDSLFERAAKTYAYMCEKAELYCTWDGGTNYIMDKTEKRAVSVYNTYAYDAGSDGWFEEFYAGE